MGMTYKDAGVDIDAADKTVDKMKKHIASTKNEFVLADVGSFGGLFELSKEFKNPVMVASSDGVGTKLKLAYESGIHNTVGQDLVNHCVNDILVQGAKPLFFLDYFGTSKLEPNVGEQIVEGFAKACRENSTALIGGETAELPGLYQPKEYDLAGFVVGVVEKDRIITGETIEPGDVVIGISSNGLHTNGYSLVYKVFEKAGFKFEDKIPELGCTLREELMKIHASYLKPMQELMKRDIVKGMAHITGGGLVDNIPRITPDNCDVEITKGTWPVLPIFKLIQEKGEVPEDDMYRTFNMGIGFVVITYAAEADDVLKDLQSMGVFAHKIGEVKQGSGKSKVILK